MLKYSLFTLIIFMLSISMKGQSPFEAYKWRNRLVVLMDLNSSNKQTVKRQLNAFRENISEVKDRDIKVVVVLEDKIIDAFSEERLNIDIEMARYYLNHTSEGYALYLIGKDTGIKNTYKEFTKPIRIFNQIDQMPMRKREMQDGH